MNNQINWDTEPTGSELSHSGWLIVRGILQVLGLAILEFISLYFVAWTNPVVIGYFSAFQIIAISYAAVTAYLHWREEPRSAHDIDNKWFLWIIGLLAVVPVLLAIIVGSNLFHV